MPVTKAENTACALIPKVGIMGGTFNPIHIGHLLLAQEAQTQFKLDKIIWIPNRTPPHKKLKKSDPTPQQRFDMVTIATQDIVGWEVSDIEILRDQPSYTLETLKRLPAEVNYTFITGMDSLTQSKWKGLEAILERLEAFIVAHRHGSQVARFQEQLNSYNLPQKLLSKIKTFPFLDLPVSSTMIRQRCQDGKSIRWLVPDPVHEFIQHHNLYQES